MSEYQYYEFHAVDRLLTDGEMDELRACSSRASITRTRFVNHYDWGNLKAHPKDWMERYFDAFLYLANWGTREIMLRFPRDVLDVGIVRAYCRDDSTAMHVGDHVAILAFSSNDEPGDDWDDGTGWLTDILPLRAEIAGGDLRALYLGWLLSVQFGALDDDEMEPPVPPGLQRLTPALKAFADFLQIDPDLITVAAEQSPDRDERDWSGELARWIAALPDDEKTSLLCRVIEEDGPHVRTELMRRFRRDCAAVAALLRAGSRSVAELTAAADRIAEERDRREAEQAERERLRREREEAAKREAYLAGLAGREPETWRRVEGLIADRTPTSYDRAAALLRDLLDLGWRDGREGECNARISALAARHARKSRLIERLEVAGLVAPVS